MCAQRMKSVETPSVRKNWVMVFTLPFQYDMAAIRKANRIRALIVKYSGDEIGMYWRMRKVARDE